MKYKLRLIAQNVVGNSDPSEPTKTFQTIQAPPAHPPYNVTVRARSATELRVRWTVSSIKKFCKLSRMTSEAYKPILNMVLKSIDYQRVQCFPLVRS